MYSWHGQIVLLPLRSWSLVVPCEVRQTLELFDSKEKFKCNILNNKKTFWYQLNLEQNQKQVVWGSFKWITVFTWIFNRIKWLKKHLVSWELGQCAATIFTIQEQAMQVVNMAREKKGKIFMSFKSEWLIMSWRCYLVGGGIDGGSLRSWVKCHIKQVPPCTLRTINFILKNSVTSDISSCSFRKK